MKERITAHIQKFRNLEIKDQIKFSLLGAFLTTIFTLNLFTRGFGVDTIVLTIFVFFLAIGKGKKFLKDWAPVILGFWVYESTRGFADNLAELLNRPLQVNSLVNLEKIFFGINDKIPSVYLQEILPFEQVPKILLSILFFFYTSFFWIWVLAGAIIWVKKREYFWAYFVGLFAMSVFDNFLYFLFPSAPPWYAAERGFLSVDRLERVMWSALFPGNGVSFVHFWDGNNFAALPSHHTAWPFFSSLFLTDKLGKKWSWTFIFPVIIIFGIVYGGEHYLIDAVTGIIVAVFFWWIFRNSKFNARSKI